MKKTILLLSAVGCLVLPAVSHADTPAKKKNLSQTRVIYYISTETRAGSHIRSVSRSADGRIDAAASPATYGSNSIRATGALDVSAVLYKLDPSFSVGRGH